MFAREAEPALISEYVNAGLITLEYRDFAFLGVESVRAAEAAMCAQDQGRFWDYHDTIFANHSGENLGAYADDRLKAMARALDLEMDEFESCFDNGLHATEIAAMYDEAAALEITSAPTIVINGEQVRYAGLADLQARLDEVLALES